MKRKTSGEKPANRGRHETWCKVCQHPEREVIEREWLGWGNTTRLAKEYGLSSDSIYRHAHALNLFEKRQRNIRKALERIIERSESVGVNASAVVGAIQAYAKINANGQWIDRVEGVHLNDLFDRMSREELEAYAKEGTLPAWFTSVTGAPAVDSQRGEERDQS
ncbi:MAG: hypothetical protein L0387_00585 [Acidobacteria bacterium]|nr:hypothetical protein [Acidobacteriota bacterium]MCI0718187.1 hypothetical protein [Acidobacteriota bacterium]